MNVPSPLTEAVRVSDPRLHQALHRPQLAPQTRQDPLSQGAAGAQEGRTLPQRLKATSDTLTSPLLIDILAVFIHPSATLMVCSEENCSAVYFIIDYAVLNLLNIILTSC